MEGRVCADHRVTFAQNEIHHGDAFGIGDRFGECQHPGSGKVGEIHDRSDCRSSLMVEFAQFSRETALPDLPARRVDRGAQWNGLSWLA